MDAFVSFLPDHADHMIGLCAACRNEISVGITVFDARKKEWKEEKDFGSFYRGSKLNETEISEST